MLKPTVYRPSECPEARGTASEITQREVVPHTDNPSNAAIEVRETTTAPAGAVVVSAIASNIRSDGTVARPVRQHQRGILGKNTHAVNYASGISPRRMRQR